MRLLFLITLTKLFGTFFAVYVFARFTQLGDSDLYLSSKLGFTEAFADRTTLLKWIGGSLNRLLGDLLSHLLFSVSVGFAIYFLIKDFYQSLRPIIRLLFWLTILSPSFMVWSSIVGKEALALISFSLVLAFALRFANGSKLNIFALLFFLCASAFIRPHYSVGLLWFVLVCIAVSQTRFTSRLNLNANLLLCILAGSLITVILLVSYYDFYEFALHFLMRVSEGYFLSSVDSGANRYWIEWQSPSDFYKNMFWGVPFAIIGPLPSEVLARPILFPFFVEGLFAFALILWAVAYTIFGLRNPQIRRIALLGFVPATLISLLIHYPFGIFNSGSALRYKQALVPILYFTYFALLALEDRLSYYGVTKDRDNG